MVDELDSSVPLKLTVEPIPATSAGKSLNRLLPQHRWDKIRKEVYAEYDHRCSICGIDPKHAPTKVYSRYAPRLADSEILEEYGNVTEETSKEPSWRKPAPVRLECHEIWEYDDEAHVQTLSSLAALCRRCHKVKHWHKVASSSLQSDGRLLKGTRFWWYRAARVRSPEQNFALQRAANPHYYFLEDHFMWVNDCDLKTMVEHVEEAAEICYRRSHYEWKIDYGAFI